MSVAAIIDSAPVEEFEPVAALPPDNSDEALALKFADQHAERLRYVAAWGRWYFWTGERWEPDSTLAALDLARGICRAASLDFRSNKPRVATSLASRRMATAVEALAKADRRMAATAEQWDEDPDLFNTAAMQLSYNSGIGSMTIDLRTGQHYVPRPIDYITKIAPVAPDGDCPLWLKFLDRITNGDKELQAYLARVCGYWLTGHTYEHALFFFYGTGANGKSVFIETIQGIMGDYGKTAPVETFMASRSERHPTELAGLRGARLVVAPETESGRHWNESRIKQLTGGDTIAARYMRQDFFEFKPTFKLCIIGNHKPSFRTVDEAFQRRINLVPFTVTIPKNERDPKLTEKLKAEWPGILAWALRGCLEWRQTGLNPPDAVRAATAEYIDAEDSFAAWLEECTQPCSGTAFESYAELFASWKQWAERASEEVGSQKRFSETLQARGYARERSNKTRGFKGIQLARPNYTDDARYGG
jgi:putative DNA primase/helicase